MPQIRVGSEYDQVRVGSTASFQLCRLPFRPLSRVGQTQKINELLNQKVCSVRQFMFFIGLLTATEKQVVAGWLHMRPIQWHLKRHWHVPESLEKIIPIPKSLHPHMRWWLNPSNVLKGQPLHPLQHALQLFTDASNEGWGAHLGDFRSLVHTRKRLAYKLA